MNDNAPIATPMQAAVAVVVMARYPVEGTVKTRLMPVLTGKQCARVHELFLQEIVERASEMAQTVIVAVDPADRVQAMHELLAGAGTVRCVPQSTGSLGDRIAAAVDHGWGIEPRLLVIGCDSPDLPARWMMEAVGELAHREVVIAPTEDGGYWCLGVSADVDVKALLRGIEWSSGQEYSQTLAAARALGYNVGVCRAWYDVDRPEDLRRLAGRLRESNDPREQSLLAQLSFLPDEVLNS